MFFSERARSFYQEMEFREKIDSPKGIDSGAVNSAELEFFFFLKHGRWPRESELNSMLAISVRYFER